MQTLQRAFCQLRLVTFGAACSSASKANSHSQHLLTQTAQSTETLWQNIPPTQICNRFSLFARCYATKPKEQQSSKEQRVTSYEPKSPYKDHRSRRYGYEVKHFTGGMLPRGEHMGPFITRPAYKPKDQWTRKKALFGQNDYIDILGDGSLKPHDLLHGPGWLVGFKGNELQRLSRRMKFEGRKLKYLYPTQFYNMRKRIWFLYKKYNRKRGKRIR